jgi:hypothetical protein
MARSTTADYAVTASEIITAAHKELELIPIGGSVTTDAQTFALQKLNLIVKNMMGPSNQIYRGMKVWQRASSTLTLTAKNNFDIYSGSTDLDLIAPVDLINVLIRNTDNEDRPLKRITRDEYDAITGKSETGDPSKYLYEREYEYGTIYFDTVISDTSDTAILTYHRALFDIDTVTDDVDYPQEWHLVLVYLLVKHLAPKYGRDYGPWAPLLQEAIENATTTYPEETTVYFQPDKEL